MGKKLIKSIFFFGAIILLSVNIQAYSINYQLITSKGVLSIENGGKLKIAQKVGKDILVETDINKIWSLTLKNKQTNKKININPDAKPIIEHKGDIIKISMKGFSNTSNSILLKVTLTISIRDDAFCFSGIVENQSDDWLIEEFTYPNIEVLEIKNRNAKIYWPWGMGECYDNWAEFGSRSLIYPQARGSMPWFTINDNKQGFYIGCHDPKRGRKEFSLAYNKKETIFKTSFKFPVFENRYEIPPVIIKLYDGKWNTAAKYYRNWFDRNFKLASIPQWAKENAGLILTIFKQQNGHVMWNYEDIDHLCDIGEKLNIKLIGVWGWGPGGHDRYYPNYMPDNLLGGRLEFIKAIERAHKRGFKVMAYANSILIDVSTDFYKYNGLNTAYIDEGGKLEHRDFVKYDNETQVVFTTACPGSKVWRDKIKNVVLDAQSLGLDGMHIDMFAVIPPNLCFSKYHDHKLPQEAYTKYRFEMIKEIRDEAQKINPDFLVMTEGIIDGFLTDIDWFHGIYPDQRVTPPVFQALFRYTFPESIHLRCNPNPFEPRFEANYASIHGIRHEIMCRYQPDVDYLLEGKIPVEEDYRNVNSKPTLRNRIHEVDKEDNMAYLHDLIQFENANGEFFRTGKFIDDDGIEARGEDIMAKGFKNGAQLGVVVWNRNLAEDRDYKVSVPGYRLVKSTEPGSQIVNPNQQLAANSIRLLIYEEL